MTRAPCHVLTPSCRPPVRSRAREAGRRGAEGKRERVRRQGAERGRAAVGYFAHRGPQLAQRRGAPSPPSGLLSKTAFVAPRSSARAQGINTYMSMLRDRSMRSDHKCYIFNSFFYPLLSSRGHRGVSRWTTKVRSSALSSPSGPFLFFSSTSLSPFTSLFSLPPSPQLLRAHPPHRARPRSTSSSWTSCSSRCTWGTTGAWRSSTSGTRSSSTTTLSGRRTTRASRFVRPPASPAHPPHCPTFRPPAPLFVLPSFRPSGPLVH